MFNRSATTLQRWTRSLAAAGFLVVLAAFAFAGYGACAIGLARTVSPDGRTDQHDRPVAHQFVDRQRRALRAGTERAAVHRRGGRQPDQARGRVDRSRPATPYYYSVGNGIATLAGDDADHFFVTAPLTGTAQPTRIWVLGDSGTANASARAVRDAYLNLTGDDTPTCG